MPWWKRIADLVFPAMNTSSYCNFRNFDCKLIPPLFALSFGVTRTQKGIFYLCMAYSISVIKLTSLLIVCGLDRLYLLYWVSSR